MQPINMIMIYYWDKKPLKRLHVLEADIIPPQKEQQTKQNIDLISLAQRMLFFQDVFQMAIIALVLIISNYHINGLHLFWDTLHVCVYIYIYVCVWEKER